MKIVWSRVNQAWFVLFGDSVLAIRQTKREAEEFLKWGV